MATIKNKPENLKKIDIIKNISSNIGISSLYSAKILNDIINILISNLVFKKKIKFKNFGIFKLQPKKKRIGRNPKNNEMHEVSERVVVTFKASDHLKKKINKNA
jgi:integration host factor subunit alpha